MGYSLLDKDAALSRVKQAYHELGIGSRAMDHAHGNPDSLVNEVMDHALNIDSIKGRLRSEYNISDSAEPTVPHVSIDDYVKRQQEAYEANRANNAKMEFDLFTEYAPKYQGILDDMMEQSRKAAADYEFELYNEYAGKYADAMQQITKELYPKQHDLGEVLAGDLKERLLADVYTVPENIKESYREDVRDAWSDRGLAYSGQSVEDEAKSLADLASEWRFKDIGTALTLDSRMPDISPLTNIPGNALSPQTNVPGFVPEVNDYFSQALNASLGKYSTDLNHSLNQSDYEMDMLQLKKMNDTASNKSFFKNMLESATQRGVNAFAQQAGSNMGNRATTKNPYAQNAN